jgi:hypothetical protein
VLPDVASCSSRRLLLRKPWEGVYAKGRAVALRNRISVCRVNCTLMSFIGSSELWGEDATARLCQILLEANDGMAQQISENRHDLLDLMTLKELERVDDCGLSLPYLAVHYDRPDMVRYLHKRGLDLSKPCDPMEFGTPMFYAVSMGKVHIVEALDSLGISVTNVCDTYMKLTPAYYASLSGDQSVTAKIHNLVHKEQLAGTLFMKNYLKSKARRRFLLMRKSAITIQKCARGLADRIMVRLVKAGAISLDQLSVGSGSSRGTRSKGGSSGTLSKASKGKKDKGKGKVKGKTERERAESLDDSINAEASIDTLTLDGSL